MTERIPCAILGASGYIGQHFARLLANHPWFEVVALTATERSGGKRLEDVWQLTEEPPPELAGQRMSVATPASVRRSGARIAFSAIPSGKAGTIESALARGGVAVFSNASDHRMDRAVPLLIPEVNPAHLAVLRRRPRAEAPLVTNPNCSATGLALALAPVLGLLRPTRVHVATYQALSGAGFPGVPSLTILDNLVPYIPTEEEKLGAETQRLLGPYRNGRVRSLTTPILAQCVRVGVRDGHLEAVTIEARKEPSQSAIERAWRNFAPLRGRGLPTAPDNPLVLRAEADRPQPARDRWAGTPERARGMAVVIGRPRWRPPFLRFFLLSHNAVRGGAGGSVLNAEFAAAEGYLPGEVR